MRAPSQRKSPGLATGGKPSNIQARMNRHAVGRTVGDFCLRTPRLGDMRNGDARGDASQRRAHLREDRNDSSRRRNRRDDMGANDGYERPHVLRSYADRPRWDLRLPSERALHVHFGRHLPEDPLLPSGEQPGYGHGEQHHGGSTGGGLRISLRNLGVRDHQLPRRVRRNRVVSFRRPGG